MLFTLQYCLTLVYQYTDQGQPPLHVLKAIYENQYTDFLTIKFQATKSNICKVVFYWLHTYFNKSKPVILSHVLDI